MKRLSFPRLYELLLAADFAFLVLVLRWKARLALDVWGTLFDMRAFPVWAGAFVLGAAAFRALLAARRGWRRGVARLRALLKPRSLADLVRFLFFVAIASYVYSWLKVTIPLLRPDVLYDAGLYRIETALHFGLNPGRLLQGLFPYPTLWRALDAYYGAFIYTVFAGIGWFGATLSIRDRARFAAGFSLLWVLGSWTYLAVPSLGPCYALGDDYTEVRAAMRTQSTTMDVLFAHYGRVRTLRSRPEGTSISPYLGVAAMPSLHIGAHAFFMLFARRRSRVVFLLCAVLTALTFFTAVVSGWHYAIDGYAALLLAWVAFAAGNRSISSA